MGLTQIRKLLILWQRNKFLHNFRRNKVKTLKGLSTKEVFKLNIVMMPAILPYTTSELIITLVLIITLLLTITIKEKFQ